MAEQTLSELVMNLISWIESLHEKNLKYEAQVESLSRDLARIQSSNEELEAKLTAYQSATMTTDSLHANSLGSTAVVSTPATLQPMNQQHIHQHQQLQQQQQQQQSQQQQPQLVYQSLPATAQSFAPQPASYMWTYDSSASNSLGANGQVSYYEHYASTTPAFAQQQQ